MLSTIEALEIIRRYLPGSVVLTSLNPAKLVWVQSRMIRMIKGLENKPYEKNLSKLSMLSLKKKLRWGGALHISGKLTYGGINKFVLN